MSSTLVACRVSRSKAFERLGSQRQKLDVAVSRAIPASIAADEHGRVRSNRGPTAVLASRAALGALIAQRGRSPSWARWRRIHGSLGDLYAEEARDRSEHRAKTAGKQQRNLQRRDQRPKHHHPSRSPPGASSVGGLCCNVRRGRFTHRRGEDRLTLLRALLARKPRAARALRARATGERWVQARPSTLTAPRCARRRLAPRRA